MTEILQTQWVSAEYPFGKPGEERFPALSCRLSPHPAKKKEIKKLHTNAQRRQVTDKIMTYETLYLIYLFMSYLHICRVCGLEQCPLHLALSSVQWRVEYRWHRNEARWCPRRCFCFTQSTNLFVLAEFQNIRTM